MNTVAPFASAGSDGGPRAYFDRLFAGLDHARVQEIADLAFAQLVLESLPEGDSRRIGPAAGPPGAAPVPVLRIVLSCARSAGVVPDGSLVVRAEAERRLKGGQHILWPPPPE